MVVRSRPSSTDRQLIAELAARGVVVTASQLERWRGSGLLPRPAVVHRGALGSKTVLLAAVADHADHVAAVAARVRRGKPLSVAAVALTADGWPVGDVPLEQGYRMLLDRAVALFDSLITPAAPAARRHELAAEAGDEPEVERGREVVDQMDHELHDDDHDDEHEDEDDGLAVAESIAGALVGDRTALESTWRRNLSSTPAVYAGERVEAVEMSAVTAMVQLILGYQPHDDAVAEMTVAMGSAALVDVIAAAAMPASVEGDRVVGEMAIAAAASCADDDAARRATVGALMSSVFVPGPIMGRLQLARDADAASIRAAGRVLTAEWAFLDHLGYLRPPLDRVRPDGDSPALFAIAVAFLVAMSRDTGLDVTELAKAGVELGIFDTDTADDVVAAGEQLVAASSST